MRMFSSSQGSSMNSIFSLDLRRRVFRGHLHRGHPGWPGDAEGEEEEGKGDEGEGTGDAEHAREMKESHPANL